MSRVFFVLNTLHEFDFGAHLERYLPDASIDIGTALPSRTESYRLIILWNYRRVVKPVPPTRNVVVFHSSDLPRGRGWAPIYYALAEGDSHLTISALLAADEVDAGEIIAKARFAIRPDYTASDLRRFDTEISIALLRRILDRFGDRPISGRPQTGLPTYRDRRTNEDNRIDLTKTFADLIPHLRGCEVDHPAFFEIAGVKYVVRIEPVRRAPDLPPVSYEFMDDAPRAEC